MHPTVLIGLDGATFTVLDVLLAGGHMPRLAELLARGTRAGLMSTPHPLTPPAWTTLMTGRSPGNHGIYDFLRAEIRDDGAFFTLNNFRDVRCETLWTIVSRQGGTITSLNFPLMAPPPPVKGTLIPGLLSWRHLRRNVAPPDLYDELKGLSGFHPQELSWDFERERKGTQVLPDEELEDWVRFHLRREQQWYQITRHVVEHHPADLTAVMFDGADKLQHSCWRFLDPHYQPAQPDDFYRLLQELSIQYFRELDEFLGEIVALAGPRARIFIASDHGFGPNEIVFRVNKWLESRGYLRWQGKAQGPAPKTGNAHYVLLDWERTRAYAQSGATNGIHVRVLEDGHAGGVPRAEYEAFCRRLSDELLAIRHPSTGQQIITGVLRREDIYPGQAFERAPDLTLVLADHGFFSVLDAEPIVDTRPVVAGTHYPEGVWVAAGPGIRQGYQAPPQQILDVAATLLYSLGLPIPEDFEGPVMRELFEPSYLAEHPVRRGPATLPPDHYASRSAADVERPDEAQDSEEKILNRLRALGYVE